MLSYSRRALGSLSTFFASNRTEASRAARAIVTAHRNSTMLSVFG